jgi:hypothetical protein
MIEVIRNLLSISTRWRAVEASDRELQVQQVGAMEDGARSGCEHVSQSLVAGHRGDEPRIAAARPGVR